MIDKEKLDRINELAHKKKTEGLTQEEQTERKALHEEYLQAIRESLRAQLDAIEIVDAAEEELTDAEKENIAFLTEKLGKEFQEEENKKKDN